PSESAIERALASSSSSMAASSALREASGRSAGGAPSLTSATAPTAQGGRVPLDHVSDRTQGVGSARAHTRGPPAQGGIGGVAARELLEEQRQGGELEAHSAALLHERRERRRPLVAEEG